jgi:transcriptional regulator with XRE-family HTH domain
MLALMRRVRLRVKEIATLQGLSRTKLHMRSEVAYVTIRNIFRNPYTEITVHTLAKLAEALDVPTSALIEDEDSEEENHS